jgi:hypothetical protein
MTPKTLRWPLTPRQWACSIALGVATLALVVWMIASGHAAGAGVVLAWPIAFRLAPFTRTDDLGEGEE